MNRINRGFPLDLLSDGSKSTTLNKGNLDAIIKDIENKITSTINKRKSCGGVDDIITRVSKYLINVEVIVKNEARVAMCQLARMFIPEALSLYGYTRAMIIEPYEKRTITVSIFRPDTQTIPLREILESKEFEESEAELPIALGIDSENNTVVADLAKMPHLLIAGDMGQGKRVLLRNIILSLLYKFSPADLKLVLIDTKQLEFSQFNQFNIIEQYLLQTSNTSTEVVTDIEKVPTILRSIDYEVQHRYDLLRISGCRTIYEYNQKFAEGKLCKNQHRHLPYIIVAIDEFADMMITQGRDFVAPLVGIAQKCRAVGIHLVIATQRPSTDIITGIIKANFPARIAFKVRSEIDSKTILDINGAEKLLGMGDMLFNNSGSITRIQGCFVDNEEVESVCDWIAKESPKDNSFVLPIISDPGTFYKPINEDRDPLFEEAARWIVEANEASTSILQRRFSIGYARACKLMGQLEETGIVGQKNGGKPRKVLKRDNEKKKSPFSFKNLINVLKSNDEEEDDSIDAVMKEDDKGKVSFAELMGLIDVNDSCQEYKIPYQDYIIIGDTAEIDKMCRSQGYINLDIPDFLSTLSKETVNYVSTGKAEGPDCVVNALADALHKLPIETDAISKLLFNVWTPKDMQTSMHEMKSMADFINVLSEDIDVVWGIAFDESMEGLQARVSLIAASK